MGDGETRVDLDPKHPEMWTEVPFEELLTLAREEVEDAQRQAVIHRFESLRAEVEALGRLTTRQGISKVARVEDLLPAFFDHKVLKSYPLSILEKRRFDQLTSWLGRLTTHDLSTMPLAGCDSVDEWLRRLDEHGMFLVHSSGTSGKLSFVPRSMVEWPAFQNAQFEGRRATCGIDLRTDDVPVFATTYRFGYQAVMRVGHALSTVSASGIEGRHPLYEVAMSSDLLALAGRLKGAEERGELDSLDLGAAVIEAQEAFIERGRHRDEDVRSWFVKLAEDFRGRKVFITGTAGDLVKLTLAGRDQGLACEFDRSSALFSGGGLKGVDAPADWKEMVRDFFGVSRISGIYSMSEMCGLAPKCTNDHYHFFPYMVPLVLDENTRPLPEQGVQTGRMALFDLIPQTYWGGFITGDRVTVHWDEECGCGWKSTWIDDDIARFGDLEGGDDKISCAGTAEAYNEFMDYVSSI